MSLSPEPGRHPARTIIGRLQILSVHPGHQVQIRRVSRCRPVVHRGTAELQQTTLLYYRKPGVSSVYHSQTPETTHSPDLRDKKSRLHLELPNLLVKMGSQRFLLPLRLCGIVAEDLGRSLNQGFLPGA